MQRSGAPTTVGLARHLFSTPPAGAPRSGAPRTAAHTLDSNENSPNQIEEEEDDPMGEGEQGSVQTTIARSDQSSAPLHGSGPKEFVGLGGKPGQKHRCFMPSKRAYKRMTEIVHGYYKGIWTSVSKAPQSDRDTWFQEFKKQFYWDVSDEEMKAAFMTMARQHIRSVFKGHRDRGTRPIFTGEEQWKKIELKRKEDPAMVRQAEVNKKNKNCQRAIDAGVYRGGSRKLSTWIEASVDKDGNKPKIHEMVRTLYTRSDGTWTGPLPATYVGNAVNLEVVNESQNDPTADVVDGIPREKLSETELWIKACGGPKNGRVFALGEEGRALIRNGKISTPPTQSSQSYQESQVLPLRQEIKDLRSTVVNLMEKQQQFQDTIIQLLRHQGGTPSTSNHNSNAGSNVNPSS